MWLNPPSMGAEFATVLYDITPLFILGHWRSGTTLLHNLMALDTSFSYLNLYQSMCPGHFLLTEPIVAPLTSWCLPKTRPMDNMPLGWNVPMEDEMAVAVDCCVSPYLMAAFQDRFELYERFLEPERCESSIAASTVRGRLRAAFRDSRPRRRLRLR